MCGEGVWGVRGRDAGGDVVGRGGTGRGMWWGGEDDVR